MSNNQLRKYIIFLLIGGLGIITFSFNKSSAERTGGDHKGDVTIVNLKKNLKQTGLAVRYVNPPFQSGIINGLAGFAQDHETSRSVGFAFITVDRVKIKNLSYKNLSTLLRQIYPKETAGKKNDELRHWIFVRGLLGSHVYVNFVVNAPLQKELLNMPEEYLPDYDLLPKEALGITARIDKAFFNSFSNNDAEAFPLLDSPKVH